MATSGTGPRSDDPVLDAALSEMVSEGALDESKTLGDLPDEPAPQGTDDAGAATDGAAEPTPTGDDAAPSGDVDPEKAASPDAPAPPDGEPPKPDADDPLAGSEPLTFLVNGQPKTFDGIYEIKGQGALIPPDKLDAVRSALANGETATLQAQHWYAKAQEFEQAGGTAKIQELAEDLATVNAAGSILAPYFIGKTVQNADGTVTHVAPDVNKLLELLQQNDDGTIGWNERARALLVKELLISTRDAKSALIEKQHTAARSAEDTQLGQQADDRAFGSVIDQIKAQLPDLTSADFEAGLKVFQPIRDTLFRKATAEDAQKYGFAVGTRILDPTKMVPWYEERAQWRASQKVAITTRNTTGRASAFNAGQDKGRQPGKQPANPAAKPSQPTIPEKGSRSEKWAAPLNEALAEMGLTP